MIPGHDDRNDWARKQHRKHNPITVVQDLRSGIWWVLGFLTGEVGAPFSDKDGAIYGAHDMLTTGHRYAHDPLPEHMKGFI
jgi:hypothetical protein